MHTLQMILKIPMTGKAHSGNTSLASIVSAKEELVAMSMHSMRFAFMS